MKEIVQEWMFNPWVMYPTLFFSQIGFSYFRAMNIRAIAEHRYWQARTSWVLYSLIYLTGSAIGIKSMWEADFFGISLWLGGAIVGLEMTMRKKK